MTSIPFTDSRWTPLSKQHRLEGESNKDGSELKSVTVGGTDWWRTTERDSHDGPTLGFRRPIGEGFEVSVELDVEAKTQFSDRSDQAAVFLHVGPHFWIKAGIEYDNGKLWNAVVVCNPYSDWSLFPRSPTDSARFTIVVKKNAADVYFGDDMIREVKWFGPTRHGNADESECPKDVFVGIMACSPLKGGANVTFREFTEKEGARGQ